MSEQESLSCIAAERAKEIPLSRCLNSFGHDLDLEGPTQTDQRIDD